jgi:L-aminopeptidase/D-esterase-like protein
MGLEVGGTGDGTVSCVEIRYLGADVHIASLTMAGKLFAAGGMGAGTGLSAVMVVVGGIGKSVLVLGRPVVRVLILWRVRWILDRDGW